MLNIDGYHFYRQDRNLHGGEVACYVQNQIPVKVRRDLAIDPLHQLSHDQGCGAMMDGKSTQQTNKQVMSDGHQH